MILNSRRRVLALLLAAGASTRLSGPPRAFAQEAPDGAQETGTPQQPEKPDCFASKDFGAWRAQATNKQTGARLKDLSFSTGNTCSLSGDLEVNGRYDARLNLYGDPEKQALPKEELVKPENRIIVKGEDGKIAVDEPLCGNCTDIYEGNVSLVLPLATAPLLRDGASVEIAIKFGYKEECSSKFETKELHDALAWAADKRDELAKDRDNDKCAAPDECFITSACCDVLGLADNCFELRSLRAYRDDVLAKEPGGAEAIALYYDLAPVILRAMPDARRNRILSVIYLRYVLPAALLARMGVSGLARRLYSAMMHRLARDFAPLSAAALGEKR